MPAPPGKDAGRGQCWRHCPDRGRRLAVIGARPSGFDVARGTTRLGLLGYGARGGAAQGAVGELAGQVALVVHGPALVGGGRAVFGGERGGAGEEVLGGRLAGERLLGARRGDLVRADGGGRATGSGPRRASRPRRPRSRTARRGTPAWSARARPAGRG